MWKDLFYLVKGFGCGFRLYEALIWYAALWRSGSSSSAEEAAFQSNANENATCSNDEDLDQLIGIVSWIRWGHSNGWRLDIRLADFPLSPHRLFHPGWQWIMWDHHLRISANNWIPITSKYIKIVTQDIIQPFISLHASRWCCLTWSSYVVDHPGVMRHWLSVTIEAVWPVTGDHSRRMCARHILCSNGF